MRSAHRALGTDVCWSSDSEHSEGTAIEVAPLDVAPAVRPHGVSICYLSAEFGPGMEAVVSRAG